MSSTCCKMFFHVYKTTSSWSSKLFGSWWELGGISQNKGHPFCSEAWMRLVDVLPRLLVAQHVQVQTQRESTKGDSTNCFLSPHCYCHYQHHRHGRLRVQLRSHILIYVTQQRLRAWLPALWCSIRTWGAIDDSHMPFQNRFTLHVPPYSRLFWKGMREHRGRRWLFLLYLPVDVMTAKGQENRQGFVCAGNFFKFYVVKKKS